MIRPHNSLHVFCGAAFAALLGCESLGVVNIGKLCPLAIEKLEPIAKANGWSLKRHADDIILVPPRELSGDELYRSTGAMIFDAQKLAKELC